jgi:hypothetical protein
MYDLVACIQFVNLWNDITRLMEWLQDMEMKNLQRKLHHKKFPFHALIWYASKISH